MGRFLQSLPAFGASMIVNARSGQSIASSVEIATTRRARRRGLLGRDGLSAGCAFVLAPCWAVHTIGMRFPIDVVFLDDDGLVLKVVEHMTGWRMAWAAAASVTVELWAGGVEAVDLHVGDRLRLAPAFAEKDLPYTPSAVAVDNTRPASVGMRPELTRTPSGPQRGDQPEHERTGRFVA